MSKLVTDLIKEFQSNDDIEDDFELYVLSISFDESGEVSPDETTEPVNCIEIDTESQEYLFHVTSDSKALSVAKIKEEISSLHPDYFLSSAQEEKMDDSSVRIDNPIIGFGENIDYKRFFLVCQK